MNDPWLKTRPLAQPYAVFTQGGWEWRVLKAYQTAEKERTNRYARWFCAVRSPYTGGSWEYGDTYITDIPGAVPGQRGVPMKDRGPAILPDMVDNP